MSLQPNRALVRILFPLVLYFSGPFDWNSGTGDGNPVKIGSRLSNLFHFSPREVRPHQPTVQANHSPGKYEDGLGAESFEAGEMETRFSDQLDHIRRPAGFTFQNRNAHSACLEASDKKTAAAELKKEQELGLQGLGSYVSLSAATGVGL